MTTRKKRTKPDAGTGLTAPQSPPAFSENDILVVKTLVVDGYREEDVLQTIREQLPHADPVTLLSVAVNQLIADSENMNQDLARGILIHAYRELYRRAFEISDFSSALAALRSFERVTGC